ncbi:MAG: malate dehydrogenase [Nitrospirae bacterium]|nr:malate dehydrogenase [Candidatus Troglogloeales bacterium]
MIKRAKVTIVGAGHVGGTTAQRLVEKEIADVVLVDIETDMPAGKALDLSEAAPICHYDSHVIGVEDYEETANSDIVVITSGMPRKPGMSRNDLLRANIDIVKKVTESVVQKSPHAILLVVSNPLDAMTYVAYKVSQFPRERVLGMAGVLDSARLSAFIAMELDVSVESVFAQVLGSHGDSMVPLLRYTTVAGIPVTELIAKNRLEAMIQRTREGGGEIVKLLKTGSAYYAPSAAVTTMVESILKDKKRILPCTVLCQGEYKINNLFTGVPVVLGGRGVEKIIKLSLNEAEEASLKESVSAIRAIHQAVDQILSSPVQI